ncbi:MAG: hypothetical protein WAN51_14405 [Alphaproteobacteria bacterium]
MKIYRTIKIKLLYYNQLIGIYAIEISQLPKKYFMNISRIMSFFTKFMAQQAGVLGGQARWARSPGRVAEIEDRAGAC